MFRNTNGSGKASAGAGRVRCNNSFFCRFSFRPWFGVGTGTADASSSELLGDRLSIVRAQDEAIAELSEDAPDSCFEVELGELEDRRREAPLSWSSAISSYFHS